ncbi:hypothetical protein UFOVP405_56 [uncultured Caudovirales phage]|uniref:Uncharacterized protein n=1 Tax=uncultured Caudovirales phage TaxID=2100421 RepID=A0A6J5MA29_9CAUD|nr:hypothetical protein UFOVP405_56 [uncultured Caudovirales phage]
MDLQTLFNVMISVLLAIVGWFARTVWDSLKEYKDRLHEVELHLPNHYVKQVDINARFDKLENMLERVFIKLDQKQDKTL